MADNLNNKNLELLAELKGGASLSGASGKRIMNQLKSIMREIQAKKVTSLQLDIDTSPQVQAKMQAQVNTLAKSLSADVKLNIQANGSKNFSQLSLSSSENTYNQALTQTAKTITNIHTPALQTLEIQAEETGEAVQSAGNKINQMFHSKHLAQSGIQRRGNKSTHSKQHLAGQTRANGDCRSSFYISRHYEGLQPDDR